MRKNMEENKVNYLTEADLKRITRKVIQNEGLDDFFPEIGAIRDIGAGIGGVISGKGYTPQKVKSSLKRTGQSFMKDWDNQIGKIRFLAELYHKIDNSNIDERVRLQLQKDIEQFILARETYKRAIRNLIDTSEK